MDDPDGRFGEKVAARYDDDSSERFRPETVNRTASVLADLADGGRALEFAVGTGRIALPLAERGIEVHGIELSRAMLRRLHAKPGGDGIRTTVGDMATTRADGTFTLVYLVFNTINNLTTQDAQVACFENAAAHLEPGGHFVIEVGVPELRKLPPGQTMIPWHSSATEYCYDVLDTSTQSMIGHYITIDGDRSEHETIPFRYVWPSELDLMARLAGMRLVHRWSGWTREPFTHESTEHVSVWQKPA
ncbi:class I SAM-dependent DNA methyltransferase [Actinomadura rupiterrae]|uniref:class I SAM-dependent DNA methyltransferase n=1 Tax=Actinomadura rupiterrae TaxID=559627 RepID=UPI0020A5E06B|nr:class I SAM-dependent methyltransferase [Actinomadura rupiterrae]MCP2338240.1 SAM-dependent methyltransferase [Actinomadura rupiterrae]